MEWLGLLLWVLGAMCVFLIYDKIKAAFSSPKEISSKEYADLSAKFLVLKNDVGILTHSLEKMMMQHDTLRGTVSRKLGKQKTDDYDDEEAVGALSEEEKKFLAELNAFKQTQAGRKN